MRAGFFLGTPKWDLLYGCINFDFVACAVLAEYKAFLYMRFE